MNTELLSRDTGVSMGLLLKVMAGVIAIMIVYTQMSIIRSRQQDRIDAKIIPNVAGLILKDDYNDKRFTKIEVQTEDYSQNKIIFKQMAKNIEEIKKVLIK